MGERVRLAKATLAAVVAVGRAVVVVAAVAAVVLMVAKIMSAVVVAAEVVASVAVAAVVIGWRRMWWRAEGERVEVEVGSGIEK